MYKSPNLFFCMWISSFSSIIFKETVLSPLYIPGTLIKDQLPISVQIYFWVVSLFCFIGLYMSLFVSLSYCLFIYLFIYLFLAVLGLCFCVRAFSSCGKWGPLFIAVHGPLTVAASLVAEHRLQMRRLSNCGSRAQLLHGMWDLPRPGPEPVSPALAGRFSTTAPPGKPPYCFNCCSFVTYFEIRM